MFMEFRHFVVHVWHCEQNIIFKTIKIPFKNLPKNPLKSLRIIQLDIIEKTGAGNNTHLSLTMATFVKTSKTFMTYESRVSCFQTAYKKKSHGKLDNDS